MKKSIFFNFFKRKNSQKKEAHTPRDSVLAEKEIVRQAKIVNLYKNNVPASTKAKVIAMFN